MCFPELVSKTLQIGKDQGSHLCWRQEAGKWQHNIGLTVKGGFSAGKN